jgi:hypothetical protein
VRPRNRRPSARLRRRPGPSSKGKKKGETEMEATSHGIIHIQKMAWEILFSLEWIVLK